MKKILFLSLLILVSCGSESNLDSKKSKKKEYTIEGTVSYIMEGIFPQAIAQIDQDCDDLLNEERLYDNLSCFSLSQCEGKRGERCVFLLGEDGSPIATATVRGTFYSFKIELNNRDDQFYTLRVEDYSNKDFYREQVFSLDETSERLDVDPSSTIAVELKKDFLRKKRDGSDSRGFSEFKNDVLDLINDIKEEVGERLDELANSTKGSSFFGKEILRAVNGAKIRIKELFDLLVSYDEVNLNSKGNEELVSLHKSILDDIESLREEISFLLNELALKDIEFKKQLDSLNNEELELLDSKSVLSELQDNLLKDQEILGHELAHVVQQNAERKEELLEIQENFNKYSLLITKDDLSEEESLELIKLQEDLIQARVFMKRKFAEEELNAKHEELTRISPDLIPEEWSESSFSRLYEELEVRVNRIDMARISVENDLGEVKDSLLGINNRLIAIGIEKTDIKRGFTEYKEDIDNQIDIKKEIIEKKREIIVLIEDILKKRNQGYLVGASPVLSVSIEDEQYFYTFRRLEFSSQEAFRVSLIKGDDLVDVLFVTRISIMDGKDGFSVKYFQGDGPPSYLHRKRPDILQEEWSMIIDESVNMLMENPLYQDRGRESNNPLYEEGGLQGENPLFEGTIDGGININFSERTSPCFCTRG